MIVCSTWRSYETETNFLYDVTIIFTGHQNAILLVNKLQRHPAHVFKAAIQGPHQVFGGERLFLKDTPFKPGADQGKCRYVQLCIAAAGCTAYRFHTTKIICFTAYCHAIAYLDYIYNLNTLYYCTTLK